MALKAMRGHLLCKACSVTAHRAQRTGSQIASNQQASRRPTNSEAIDEHHRMMWHTVGSLSRCHSLRSGHFLCALGHKKKRHLTLMAYPVQTYNRTSGLAWCIANGKGFVCRTFLGGLFLGTAEQISSCSQSYSKRAANRKGASQ